MLEEPGVRIRPMREEDLPQASAFFAEAFRASPWNEPWTEDSALRRLTSFFHTPLRIGLVAESHKSELLGMLLGAMEEYADHRSFFLREMAVHVSYQRLGIGEAMLQSLHEILLDSGIHSVYLVTRRSSYAMDFYRSHGFIDTTGLAVMSHHLHSTAPADAPRTIE